MPRDKKFYGHDGREGAARHRTGTRDAPKTKVWGGSVVTDNCAILPSFVQINAVIFHILTDGRRSDSVQRPYKSQQGTLRHAESDAASAWGQRERR